MQKLIHSRPLQFLAAMVQLYFRLRVSRSAAALAYFMVLSFFPLLICLQAFLGLWHVDLSQAFQAIAAFLPGNAATLVVEYGQYLENNRSLALLVAGIATTIGFASAGLRSLLHTMDELYRRNTFSGIVSFLASFLLSLFLLLTIYLSVAVVITGNWFFSLLGAYFPISPTGGHWQWSRFLFLFAIVFLFVCGLYRLTAPGGKDGVAVMAGAILTTFALVGASMAFSLFLTLSSRYSLVYGSLAGVILLLVWLYLCGNILILGNVFNRVRWERKHPRE